MGYFDRLDPLRDDARACEHLRDERALHRHHAQGKPEALCHSHQAARPRANYQQFAARRLDPVRRGDRENGLVGSHHRTRLRPPIRRDHHQPQSRPNLSGTPSHYRSAGDDTSVGACELDLRDGQPLLDSATRHTYTGYQAWTTISSFLNISLNNRLRSYISICVISDSYSAINNKSKIPFVRFRSRFFFEIFFLVNKRLTNVTSLLAGHPCIINN